MRAVNGSSLQSGPQHPCPAAALRMRHGAAHSAGSCLYRLHGNLAQVTFLPCEPAGGATTCDHSVSPNYTPHALPQHRIPKCQKCFVRQVPSSQLDKRKDANTVQATSSVHGNRADCGTKCVRSVRRFTICRRSIFYNLRTPLTHQHVTLLSISC